MECWEKNTDIGDKKQYCGIVLMSPCNTSSNNKVEMWSCDCTFPKNQSTYAVYFIGVIKQVHVLLCLFENDSSSRFRPLFFSSVPAGTGVIKIQGSVRNWDPVHPNLKDFPSLICFNLTITIQLCATLSLNCSCINREKTVFTQSPWRGTNLTKVKKHKIEILVKQPKSSKVSFKGRGRKLQSQTTYK